MSFSILPCPRSILSNTIDVSFYKKLKLNVSTFLLTGVLLASPSFGSLSVTGDNTAQENLVSGYYCSYDKLSILAGAKILPLQEKQNNPTATLDLLREIRARLRVSQGLDEEAQEALIAAYLKGGHL